MLWISFFAVNVNGEDPTKSPDFSNIPDLQQEGEFNIELTINDKRGSSNLKINPYPKEEFDSRCFEKDYVCDPTGCSHKCVITKYSKNTGYHLFYYTMAYEHKMKYSDTLFSRNSILRDEEFRKNIEPMLEDIVLAHELTTKGAGGTAGDIHNDVVVDAMINTIIQNPEKENFGEVFTRNYLNNVKEEIPNPEEKFEYYQGLFSYLFDKRNKIEAEIKNTVDDYFDNRLQEIPNDAVIFYELEAERGGDKNTNKIKEAYKNGDIKCKYDDTDKWGEPLKKPIIRCSLKDPEGESFEDYIFRVGRDGYYKAKDKFGSKDLLPPDLDFVSVPVTSQEKIELQKIKNEAREYLDLVDEKSGEPFLDDLERVAFAFQQFKIEGNRVIVPKAMAPYITSFTYDEFCDYTTGLAYEINNFPKELSSVEEKRIYFKFWKYYLSDLEPGTSEYNELRDKIIKDIKNPKFVDLWKKYKGNSSIDVENIYYSELEDKIEKEISETLYVEPLFRVGGKEKEINLYFFVPENFEEDKQFKEDAIKFAKKIWLHRLPTNQEILSYSERRDYTQLKIDENNYALVPEQKDLKEKMKYYKDQGDEKYFELHELYFRKYDKFIENFDKYIGTKKDIQKIKVKPITPEPEKPKKTKTKKSKVDSPKFELPGFELMPGLAALGVGGEVLRRKRE